MPPDAYSIALPRRRTTAVVFASPHSGRAYPESFLATSRLDSLAIRSSEDAFVDLLYDRAPDFGAPFLTALAPRAYVDLNRAPEELDPALIAGVRRISQNPRVSSGLGVIPRVVAGGRAIYTGRIPIEDAHDRISAYWRPYHDRLQTLLDESRRDFGMGILIDCHSMPHEALDQASQNGTRPEIVIGDRFGAAASPRIVEAVEAAFVAAGLRVARNNPFAGAYITQAYGRPSRHQHAIQVEVDRALYMDEATLTLRPDFADFKALITGVLSRIAAIGAPQAGQLAAE
ncbi:N-formylglutamate deformylase [Loktanella sp. DSM 29012]|uniref:N-formylglutamate amidohydrolase n=1 Tax=Loktanella sp. DSM 29012 TaxID=1881056 RepID=UPI0008D1303C|nr:N-formylglutamate amidohydrolase [Loktanella sp. DSM 29012]SEP55798.1 N-formylglutamate deformylase [Loktanella sp. DSM 29012]